MKTRFAAKFVGICDACRERFPVGTFVNYNDQGKVEHCECPEDGGDVLLSDLDGAQDACPDCHVVHAKHQKECW